MKARYFHLIRGAILLIILLTGCAPAPANPPGGSTSSVATGDQCVNAYYPIPAQASWSYSSSGSPSLGTYTYTRSIAARSNTSFTSSDKYSTGAKWTAQWTCKDGNLTAMDTGPGSASMTTSSSNTPGASVTADGYSIPSSFETDKTWSERVSIKGPVTSNGRSVATSQIVALINCHVGSPETITVPAGRFDTLTAICSKNVVVSAVSQGMTVQLGATHQNITYWYAEGIGLVKSVATGGKDNETIVLTGYKLP